MTTNSDDLDLVVDALRARAAQRRRAAGLLADQLAEKRAAGTDVRSGSLRVVDELAAANRLDYLADEAARGYLIDLARRTATGAGDGTLDEKPDEQTLADLRAALTGQPGDVDGDALAAELAALDTDDEDAADEAEVANLAAALTGVDQ